MIINLNNMASQKQDRRLRMVAHAKSKAQIAATRSPFFYPYTNLYPVLFLLRSLGNAYLSKYNKSPGRDLIKAFLSFNTMRRTARLVVAKKRAETLRAATPVEVVEHERWQLSCSSLDIP
jgi:hypothetical protein